MWGTVVGQVATGAVQRAAAFATARERERAVGRVEACSLPCAGGKVAPVPGDGDIAVIPAVDIGHWELTGIGCGWGFVKLYHGGGATFIADPIKAALVQHRAPFAGNLGRGWTGGKVETGTLPCGGRRVTPVPCHLDIAIVPTVGVGAW